MAARPEHSASQEVLRVARWKQRCQVLGPGVRAVVWFHGCSLQCRGCIAHEMNTSAHHQALSPMALAARLANVQGIEGVTLSGGDPFDQHKPALLALLTRVRESGRSVMCYTGRTLEQLTNAHDGAMNRAILANVDILVDGPYVENLNKGELWRGSANQRIHFLTPRYRHLAKTVAEARSRMLEFDLALDGTLTLAGIPEPGFLKRLAGQLERRGVRFAFKEG